MRELLAAAAAALAFATATPSVAGVVSLGFEEASGQVVYNNYYTQGFRFSPNSHYDVGDGPTGQWLGWDHGAPAITPPHVESNPFWFGPPELSPYTNGNQAVGSSWMYIDAAGAHFDLESFDLIAYGLEVHSSKGGVKSVEIYDGSSLPISFSGDEWKGLTWLLIRGGSGVPAGFDNVVFRVPEPNGGSLVVLAIGAMALCRRRKASFPSDGQANCHGHASNHTDDNPVREARVQAHK